MINQHKAFSLIEISVVILIIGILISGISKGLDLYYDYKISNARLLTKNSPVQRIEGLLTWIETTSTESFSSTPSENSKVSLIKDLNFRNNIKIDFFQNNDLYKPLYQTRAINDLPALYFDGSDDYMLSNDSFRSNIFPNNQITIFMVMNFLGGNETAVAFKHELGSYRIGLEINSGKLRFDFPTYNISVYSTSIVNKKNVIVTATADNVNQKIFINSLLQQSQVNNINIPTSSLAYFHLGINPGGTLATKFYFGELIIYDVALNDSQINLINKYLSQKWGIKI